MTSLTSLIKQKQFCGIRKCLCSSSSPVSLVCIPGEVGKIRFPDGSICSSSCLGCEKQYCMKYDDEEIQLNGANHFYSIDNDNNVCPALAISWNTDKNCPEFNQAQCIKCGICVKRCPAKAIYISDNIGVASEPNQILCSTNDEGAAEETITKISLLPLTGCILQESDKLISEVYERINSLKYDQQFPNRLARNLLMALGLKAHMRRRGDVYSRTDLMFFYGVFQGVCEIEFADLLDTPRDILDDMAVLISRYNVKRDDIIPLVIGLALPNGRSEFWEVINDIQKVLHFKIHTITIGALIVLVWNNKHLNLDNEQFPYADSENCSIRSGLNKLLGRDVSLSVATYNVLEPVKSSR